MDIFLILACIFIVPPLILTVLNIWNLCAKKAFFPRVLLLVTVGLGIYYKALLQIDSGTEPYIRFGVNSVIMLTAAPSVLLHYRF